MKKKKAIVIIYFCDRSDGRSGILRNGFLVNANGGGDAFDLTNFGFFFHASHKHTRIRGEAFEVSSLSLGTESGECK